MWWSWEKPAWKTFQKPNWKVNISWPWDSEGYWFFITLTTRTIRILLFKTAWRSWKPVLDQSVDDVRCDLTGLVFRRQELAKHVWKTCHHSDSAIFQVLWGIFFSRNSTWTFRLVYCIKVNQWMHAMHRYRCLGMPAIAGDLKLAEAEMMIFHKPKDQHNMLKGGVAGGPGIGERWEKWSFATAMKGDLLFYRPCLKSRL